jgi:hypothetical protein
MPGLLVAAVGLTALGTTSIPTLASPMTLLGCLVLGVAALVLWGALSGPSPHRRPALKSAAVGAAVGVLLLVLTVLAPRASALALNLRTPVNIKMGMIWAFTLGGVAAVLAALRNSRTGLVGSLGALALGFALWFSWSHWVDLSHHWTQRDLFWRYYDRRAPGEPIVAYMMDWKGETPTARTRSSRSRTARPAWRPSPLCQAGSGRWSSTPGSGCSVRPSVRNTASSRWTGTST